MIKVSEGVTSSTAPKRNVIVSHHSASVKRLLSSVRHYQRVVFPLSSFTSGLGLALLQLDFCTETTIGGSLFYRGSADG